MSRHDGTPNPLTSRSALGSVLALGALTLVTACGDAASDGTGASSGAAGGDSAPGAGGSHLGTGGAALTMGGTDRCPGARVILQPGAQVVIDGDTSLANDDYGTSCGPRIHDGPDVMFDVAVAGTGSLTARLRPKEKGYDPTLVLRRGGDDAEECPIADEDDTLLCLSFWESQESFALDVGPDAAVPFQDQEYTLIVDGAEGQAGRYSLELSFAPPACGDGVLNHSTGEQCDDGNVEASDGCSPTCTIEAELVGDLCGDPTSMPVVVEPGAPELVSGATWGYGDDYAPVTGLPGQGCSQDAFGGGDHVVPFVPSESGTMTVSVGLANDGHSGACERDGLATPLCWDARLWVAGPNVCDADSDGTLDGEQLACADEAHLDLEIVSFEVVAGAEYYAVVEPAIPSPTAADGAFNLRFDLWPIMR